MCIFNKNITYSKSLLLNKKGFLDTKTLNQESKIDCIPVKMKNSFHQQKKT